MSDSELIQIVDGAVAEAARKSGAWLVCRPGCTQCCIGPFGITALDVVRLRRGLAHLESSDSFRAERVRWRAEESVARVATAFPGDPVTGILGSDPEAEERFSTFADEEPCPALDPDTGTCDLYAFRPITCRVFGPPVRTGPGSVAVCELCYRSASDSEIAACEVEAAGADDLESALLRDLEENTGARGQTIVAFALLTSRNAR